METWTDTQTFRGSYLFLFSNRAGHEPIKSPTNLFQEKKAEVEEKNHTSKF